jgi:uncharacterized protein
MIELAVVLALLLLLLGASLLMLAIYGLNQWTRPARIASRDHPRNYDLPFEEVYFTARDGVKLHGWLIAPFPLHPSPNLGEGMGVRASTAIIFCHGHGGLKDPDLIYAPWFYERGIPVLLFDFRNHGLSEGSLTSIGFYERYDLLGAIDLLVSRGITRIGLFGFSMGAATAIATTPLSEHVVCVVADSPFAQLRPTLARAIQLRGFPRWFAQRFIGVIFWMGKRRLKCDPAEADPVRAVSQFGQRPLLLILGARDEYIEPWQGQLLYDSASGPMEFWLVPDAAHRDIDRGRPELYRERVMGFFERWLVQNMKAES